MLHPDSLHHAYICTGDTTKATEYLISFLEKDLSFSRQANPDYVFLEIPTLSIDEARNLKVIHSKKPFGERRIFLIKTDSVPVESQNALLKLFEEPEPGNHFFIVIERPVLLPTLRSRIQLIDFEQEKSSAKKFLAMNKKERFDHVAKLEKNEGYALAHEIGSIKKDKPTLEAVLRVKKYIFDRGSSTKQLLEYLAVSV